MAADQRRVIKIERLGSLNELANGLGLTTQYVQTPGKTHYTNTYTLDINFNGKDVRLRYEETLPNGWGVLA